MLLASLQVYNLDVNYTLQWLVIFIFLVKASFISPRHFRKFWLSIQKLPIKNDCSRLLVNQGWKNLISLHSSEERNIIIIGKHGTQSMKKYHSHTW